MPDIVINPSLGKIDFFTVKGEQVTNSMVFVGSNMGIGTTVPSASLHINSTTAGATLLRTDGTNGTLFSVVDDLSDSLMSVNNSAGLPVLEVFTDDRIVAGQYGQNDFVVINNKVGIGTNNPPFKLYVTGSLGVNASSLDTNWPFVVSDNSSAGSRYGLNKAGSMGFNNADNYAQLQLVGTNGAYLDLTNSVGGDSNARLIYYAGSRLELTYGFTTTITLNSTGVGIGTTVPSGELHIYGAQPAFRIQSSVSGSMQFGQWDGTYNRIQSSARDFLLISTDATNLIFSTNTTERMRITSGGNIGIGTTAPLERITFGSSDSIIARSSDTEFNSGYCSRILFNQGGTGYGYLGFYTYQGGTGGGERMRIAENGNVGIGTTAPGARLEISSSTAASLLNIKGAGGNAILFVSGSGNVGIGTTSPTDGLLSLNGTYPQLNINNPSTGSGVVIQLRDNGRAAGAIGHFTSTNYLQFSTAGQTAQITLTNIGNVGIGTTNPNSSLQVSGSVTIGPYNTLYSGTGVNSLNINATTYPVLAFYYGTTLAGLVGGYSDHMSIYAPASKYISFDPGDSEKMRIQADGNVGIGTTSPGRKLHLYAPQSVISLSNTGTGAWSGLQWSVGNGAYTAYSGLLDDTGRYFIDVGSNGDDFTILQNGNVGIGTTSPISKLEAYGGSMDPTLTPGDTSIFSVNSLGVQLAVGRMVTTPFSIWFQGKHATVTGSLTYPIVLNPLGGFVGIGTTAPAATLHVSGSSGATATFQGSTQSTMNLKVGSFDNYLVGTSTGDISIRPSGSTAVTILSNGSVGIGTTSPTYKLYVNGDLRAGAGSFLGSVTGTKGIFSDASGVGSVLEAYNTVATNATTAIIRQTTAGGNGNQDIGLLVDIQGANDLDRIANFRYYDGSTYTSRMVIMRGGNVGIGTTSPANKLEVKGADDATITAIFQSTAGGNAAYNGGIQLGNAASSQNSQIYHNSSGDNTLTFVSNYSSGTGNKFIFSPGGTEKVRFQQNGNVGIGTTVPIAKLHVSWGTDAQSVKMLGAGGSTNGNFIYSLASDWSDTFGLNVFATNHVTTARTNNLVRIHSNETSNGSLPLRVTAQGTIASPTYEALAVNYLGNVGIGTTSPAAKLHLNSTVAAATLLRADGTSGTLFSVVDDLSDSLMSVNNSAGLPVLEVFADDRIVGGQYGQNDLVVVNNKVGIGTNNPLAKLHVTGSASVPAAVFMGNVGIGTTSPSTKLHIYENANRVTYISQNDNHTARFEAYGTATAIDTTASNGIFFRINGSDIVKFAANGNVGIGFTAPAANLHVFGPTMIVGDSNITQNVRQTIVGSTTGNASTTAKKIFVCGHTSTGTINVTAFITAVSTASATATFSFANAYGNNVTPNRLSYISLNSTITSIDCSYNNSGYQMEIAVTYTGATAPTLYFTAEGMGSSIWTL